MAWHIAREQRWPDTYLAEYVALTRLQADALITLDEGTAGALRSLVDLAPMASLLA
jgi:indolepyruvate ferredoxin oxidoreductase alpha subunit